MRKPGPSNDFGARVPVSLAPGADSTLFTSCPAGTSSTSLNLKLRVGSCQRSGVLLLPRAARSAHRSRPGASSSSASCRTARGTIRAEIGQQVIPAYPEPAADLQHAYRVAAGPDQGVGWFLPMPAPRLAVSTGKTGGSAGVYWR